VKLRYFVSGIRPEVSGLSEIRPISGQAKLPGPDIGPDRGHPKQTPVRAAWYISKVWQIASCSRSSAMSTGRRRATGWKITVADFLVELNAEQVLVQNPGELGHVQPPWNAHARRPMAHVARGCARRRRRDVCGSVHEMNGEIVAIVITVYVVISAADIRANCVIAR
jgi:hypothetical protein